LEASLFEFLFKYPLAEFGKGTFVYLSRLPGEVRFLLFAAFVGLVWLFYRKVSAKVQGRKRWVLFGLRLATYALVFFILGMPALQSKTPKKKSYFTAVLVDTSRSMSIEDVDPGSGEKISRISAARRVLFDEEGRDFLKWLDEHSNLLMYEFDSGARRRARGKALKAEGSYTNIFRSVRDVDMDLRALPLVAVVLLTDGCRNTGGTPEDAATLLATRGARLHVVGLGDPVSPKDYEVVHVFAPRTVRRNTEVELQLTLRHTGYEEPFKVRVMRNENELLAREVEPSQETDLELVRIAFTPDHKGTATYTVEIPSEEGEKVTENNSKEFVLDISDDRLPVLNIEGSPRQEYRFPRRAMFRDPDFRVVGMLRFAKDKFYVQGANEEEQYLSTGFPDTREKLYAFQTVILGDIEAEHFTPEQLNLLREFVHVRGGGLLMLGGVNSFGLGKYARTPVGRMLPVAVSDRDPAYSDEQYDPKAVPRGLSHPVMRISPEPEEAKKMWEKAPPLIGITPVSGVKAGATLLIVKDGDGSPVLAVQNYGAGRVAAFTSGGSWYWQVSKPAEDEFHEKFWKQLIRWLVMGARQQLEARMDRDIYGRRDPVVVRATVLGKDLKPVNDATVIASVTDPLANKEEIPMHWTLSEEGVYQCRYTPAESGNYTVSVRVEGWDEVKPSVTGFMVTEPLVEFRNSNLKEELLKRMAETTGGRYFAFEDAGKLREELENSIRQASLEGVEPETKPLWDMPILYVMVLALMGVEWLYRRRSGLA
jgi:uncharacterized membrane protein